MTPDDAASGMLPASDLLPGRTSAAPKSRAKTAALKRVAITKRDAASLKPAPGAAEAFLWDATVTGLALRAYASGRKVWLLQYRDVHGRTRRIGLGDAGALTPEDARKAAGKHLAQKAIGNDPAAARGAARHGKRVAELIELYLKHVRSHIRASTFDQVQRNLMKYAAPLHSEPVSAVGRGDVFKLHGALSASAGAIQANRVLAALSSMFAWAMRAGLAESNPAALVPRNAETVRERVLSNDEVAAILRATGTGSDYARIVRLLLLTGCRREEIGGLQWQEVDGDVITLGKGRTKTGVVHEVPLTELARAQLPERVDDREFVFGKGEGFSGWSKAKARLDAAVGFEWRLHDLRRTISTRLNEAGVDPHVVEALLGHAGARAGVAGVYNKASYRDQKRQALEKWAKLVSGLGNL